jgi:hypothetical protein
VKRTDLMALLFDRRSQIDADPGCHALIIGVSSYPHLMAGDGPPAPNQLGKGQLSCGASCAARVTDWLINHQDRLAAPLATCRTLLSPSTQETVPSCEKATLRNLLTAAAEWRADLSGDRRNIAFFYFVGHGLELSSMEQALLMSDFGDGVGPLLKGSVTVNNLFYGMAPTARTPHIARTQVFFVDTGRTHHPGLQPFELHNTTAVFDADLATLDDRSAGVFYGAAPGGNAMAFRGEDGIGRTVLSESLLMCLDGAAAVAIDETDLG